MKVDKCTITITVICLNIEILKNLFDSFDTRERQDFLHFIQARNKISKRGVIPNARKSSLDVETEHSGIR